MHCGAFRVSGRVPQVFSIFIEMLAAVLHRGTRVGRLPTRVTKQCPLPVWAMTSGRRESLLFLATFYFITFNIEMK